METVASPNSTNEPSAGDIAQASVMITLGVLVGFCSLLTILVVTKFRSVSNPDILILALAIIDFISSWTVFPMAAFWYLRTGAFPGEVCLVYASLTTAIQLASTVIISLMTVDRFLAIRRPILYRTRLGSPQLKRLVVVVVFISTVIGSLPAALSATNWTTAVNRHGYCTFRYASDFTYLILAISLPQIPLLAYCSYGFLVSIQKFIRRRKPQPGPSPGSGTLSPSEAGRRNRAARPAASAPPDGLIARCRACICCCCCCRSCRDKQRKAVWKEEVLEKTQTAMKNLHLKRCTRMSKTVALVVAIYYIPWLLALVIMLIELITRVEDNNSLSNLNLVMVRLMMAHSIFYPVVYASVCDNYRQAYKWALSLPFHSCGVQWHERPPLGLTVSEMHRISHQMALEEWESPGLNRRLYSKRPYLKRSATNSLQDAANAESDAVGQDNPAFDRHERTSLDEGDHQVAAADGLITVEVVHENAGKGACSDATAPSVSVHQVVPPMDSPRLPERPRPRPHTHEESKQGTSAPRRSLENQTSDSGVDVDSIHLDSVPSGSNSPAIYRLETVESESATSVSEVTEHALAQADSTREKETSFIIQTNRQGNTKAALETPNINVTEAGDLYERYDAKNQLVRNNENRLQTFTKQANTEIADLGTGHDLQNDISAETDDATAKEDDVIAGDDDVVTEHGHVHPRTTAEKSTGTDLYSVEYGIKETSPGKNSVLRIEPCSSGGQCQGLIRIHVEVVELRPDTPPLAADTCALQSKTSQYHVKPAGVRPSLKFSIEKNRFVPCTSSLEETDSYSLDLSGQSVDNASATLPTPTINVPDGDHSEHGGTSDAETEAGTLATTGETDGSQPSDDPPAKGFKTRRMRASKALRESARYNDDITRYSEMILRRQNEGKISGVTMSEVKEEANESKASGLS